MQINKEPCEKYVKISPANFAMIAVCLAQAINAIYFLDGPEIKELREKLNEINDILAKSFDDRKRIK